MRCADPLVAQTFPPDGAGTGLGLEAGRITSSVIPEGVGSCADTTPISSSSSTPTGSDVVSRGCTSRGGSSTTGAAAISTGVSSTEGSGATDWCAEGTAVAAAALAPQAPINGRAVTGAGVATAATGTAATGTATGAASFLSKGDSADIAVPVVAVTLAGGESGLLVSSLSPLPRVRLTSGPPPRPPAEPRPYPLPPRSPLENPLPPA
mmetsp:Transcript_16044/g.23950  ORF Transcript_16044/g.23950 Transcript_16044/m.23950 type:complete len:208 (-) Transcript_16044:417-1040(-)